jgi:hypothetical protein
MPPPILPGDARAGRFATSLRRRTGRLVNALADASATAG